MKFHQFLLCLIFITAISSVSLKAQRRKEIPPEVPTLIIGIVVEDMRYDYLNKYWDNFSEGGFKRLVNEGTFCRNANYNYVLTQTAPGYATIATGCEPVVHGVVSDNWYQRLQKKSINAVYDGGERAVGTDGLNYQYSPGNLLTTTFTDELKLFNNGQSKVVGISFGAEGAILPGGHLANAAYWFDDLTGNWVSSTYYMDSLPEWVNTFNNKNLPEIYIEREWQPTLPIEEYRQGAVAGNSKNVGFSQKNKFARRISEFIKKDEKFSILKATPYGLSLTKDFALAAILDEQLGKDEFTDFLSLGFSSTSTVSMACGPNSVELEDIYLQLDKNIEHFLQFIDDNFGKHNVLIYLTSDNGTAYSPERLEKYRIPSGVFNADRAVMLLRTYLNAVYDKGNWITAYHNKQIYLNHLLIEEAGLELEEVQNVVSRFIIQFSGVANATTSSTLEKTNFTEGVFSFMQNSFNQKRSGDIIINLEPGWIEKGNYLTSGNSAHNYDIHVPLIWYGWKIKRSKINQKVQIKDIAPTLCNFLQIPFPNGNTGIIIDDLGK